jgi:hypothetical protein
VATLDQFRTLTLAQPFRPFLVKLACGGSFEVRHPENVACSLNGEEMTVYDEQGMHLVDMMLVEVLEQVPSSGPKSKAKGNRK